MVEVLLLFLTGRQRLQSRLINRSIKQFDRVGWGKLLILVGEMTLIVS